MGSRGPMQPMSAPFRMPCSSLEPRPCQGGGPARSGVESAVRGCGRWVAGAGGLGPLPGGGAWGTADRSPSPDGTADKSPSRHVDGTLSTFTVLLKLCTRHLTQHQIRPLMCMSLFIIVLPLYTAYMLLFAQTSNYVTIHMYVTGDPVSLLPLQPEGPRPDPSLPGHDGLGLSAAPLTPSGCTGRRRLPL